MSKLPSPDLFLLIKSLHKTEKGYIRKYAFMHDGEDANFIRLFKAIDSQEEYNETELLRSEKYIRQLPRMKIYLFEFILDTLANYYSKKNAYLNIRQIINRITVLFDKGLYDACIRQLLKAKELSRRFEYFTMELETLQWERTLMIEKQLLSDFPRIESEEKKLIDKISEVHNYHSAYRKVSTLYSEIIYIRSSSENARYKKLLPQSQFRNEKLASSLTSKILLLKSKAKYLSAFGDIEMYLKLSHRLVDIMESHPHFIENDILQYIKALNNVIVASSETGRIKEYNFLLVKLAALPDKFESANTPRIRALISLRVITRQFYHAKFHAQFENAKKLIPEFEKCIRDNIHLISGMHHFLFKYSIAYIHFINNDQKQVLNILSKITEEQNKKDMFYVFSRILQTLIHIENGNTELAESLIRSTLRFIKNYKYPYTLENSFLRFLRSGLDSTPAKNDYRKYYSSIQKRVKDFDHMILEYFDFPAWIRAKINETLLGKQLVSESKSNRHPVD